MACINGFPTGVYNRLRGVEQDIVYCFELGASPCKYGTKEIHVAVQYEGMTARFRGGLYDHNYSGNYPGNLLAQTEVFTAVVTGVPYWFTLALDNFVYVAQGQRIWMALHLEYNGANDRVQGVQYTQTAETPLTQWMGVYHSFDSGPKDPFGTPDAGGTIHAGYGYIKGYSNPTAIAVGHPVMVD